MGMSSFRQGRSTGEDVVDIDALIEEELASPALNVEPPRRPAVSASRSTAALVPLSPLVRWKNANAHII